MKDKVQAMLDDVIATTEFRQHWDKEHPEIVDEQRRAVMHFLDGKREALEAVLELIDPKVEVREVTPVPKIPLKRKRLLPLNPKFPEDPKRYAVSVSFEKHVMGSMIHIHTVNEDGAQRGRFESWLAADAPRWARKVVGL